MGWARLHELTARTKHPATSRAPNKYFTDRPVGRNFTADSYSRQPGPFLTLISFVIVMRLCHLPCWEPLAFRLTWTSSSDYAARGGASDLLKSRTESQRLSARAAPKPQARDLVKTDPTRILWDSLILMLDLISSGCYFTDRSVGIPICINTSIAGDQHLVPFILER